jgi:hypothetical protein
MDIFFTVVGGNYLNERDLYIYLSYLARVWKECHCGKSINLKKRFRVIIQANG